VNGIIKPLGYALTPQAFSISNLVLGLVPHHPGADIIPQARISPVVA